MIVSILQSGYLPWIGFFDMVHKSDAFVFHDDIQYDKSWRNRNRIRGEKGPVWLTVPVRIKGRSYDKLSHIEIASEHKWELKHWHLILNYYFPAPFFKNYQSFFKEVYSRPWQRLIELNHFLILWLFKELGISTPVIYSNDLNLGEAKGNERIIKICRILGADTWLANSACRNYVTASLYEKENIKIIYHDYAHPSYRQLYEPFIPYLSIIDLLLNRGPDSLAILTGQLKIRYSF